MTLITGDQSGREQLVSQRVDSSELVSLFERCLNGVRDDLRDSPYLEEAVRVLPVGGFRSAIGSFWNAVVDDLRNKILHRGASLFSKAIGAKPCVTCYEDFQDHVNDDQLIIGAYKIGVIGWEAHKILRHAKETRHIFDGHPKSSNPSPFKVLAMLDDCVRYVLAEPYPPKIIDIDDYLAQIGSNDFDRNEISADAAISDLPAIYKKELAHRLVTAYVHPEASTTLRGNIEFVGPVLWRVLPKSTKIEVARRVDTLIPEGNADSTRRAVSLIVSMGGVRYLSMMCRKYILAPLIQKLAANLDEWQTEDAVVRELEPFSGYVPEELIPEYVQSLTLTYVGHTGASIMYSRTDFYANGAALRIPGMFGNLDDNAAEHFVDSVRTNTVLRKRIGNPAKLARLRVLGEIMLERVSESFQERGFLEVMIDPEREEEFFKHLGSLASAKQRRAMRKSPDTT